MLASSRPGGQDHEGEEEMAAPSMEAARACRQCNSGTGGSTMNEPWEVILGDAKTVLEGMAAGSVHTVCCSPPYWALRSYLPQDDQQKALEMGSERSPDCFAWARGSPRCEACYVCRMTEVFAAVKRVLRDDGTAWVNIGGSYNSNPSGFAGTGSAFGHSSNHDGARDYGRRKKDASGWKQKDFVNVPALLAESLRADGWILRSEIQLTKLSPMPESVRDRPTRATEKLYLFAKRSKYFYDMEAERIGLQPGADHDRIGCSHPMTSSSAAVRDGLGNGHEMNSNPAGRNLWDYWDSTDDDLPPAVWPWRPEPSRVKHYATFPLWLPLRVVRLATSAKGVCPRCGGPWRRVVERKFRVRKGRVNTIMGSRDGGPDERGWDGYPTGSNETTTLGWTPSCTCPAADPVPSTILDPFCGTGTTLVAARLLGRRALGIDLSAPYVKIARERLATAAPLDDAAWRIANAAAGEAQPTLFDTLSEEATP